MMFTQEVAVVVRATLTAIVVVLLVRKYWRESLIDDFRHRLFVLRADLFDYALSGEIGFRDPAYTMLRESLNSILRFADKITPTRCLVITVFSRPIQDSGFVERHVREWSDALNALESDAARERVEKIHEQALLEVGRHMILGQLPLVLLLSNMLLMHALWEWFRGFLLAKARIVEVEARHSRQIPARA